MSRMEDEMRMLDSDMAVREGSVGCVVVGLIGGQLDCGEWKTGHLLYLRRIRSESLRKEV